MITYASLCDGIGAAKGTDMKRTYLMMAKHSGLTREQLAYRTGLSMWDMDYYERCNRVPKWLLQYLEDQL